MTFIPAPSESNQSATRLGKREPFYRRYLVAIVAGLAGIVFLAAPWSFEHKAHAAMHGLCAQTPSHTFFFDGRALPFDGRMTGIYGGLFFTVVILVAMARHRAAGLPSTGAGVLLLIFFGSMAVDGFNSLLTDLDKWHPYAPSNELRVITGWMAGIGIGAVMVMLVGMTLWNRPKTSARVIEHWWEPFALLLPIIPIRLLMEFGTDFVYYPLSVLLMSSAVIAFTTLVLVTMVMLMNRENQFERFAQLRSMTAVSMVIAIAIILAIGGGRFWLESVVGVPALV